MLLLQLMVMALIETKFLGGPQKEIKAIFESSNDVKEFQSQFLRLLRPFSEIKGQLSDWRLREVDV